MKKETVFGRTQLGNQLLGNPQGIISGDDVLLLALIDGQTSIEGITRKIPPSVRVRLDTIFARLLSAQIIADTNSAETGSPTGNSGHADGTQTLPDQQLEATNKRCADLEQELAYARSQLDANKARLQEVAEGLHKLRLRVSAYSEVTHARLTKRIKELGAQAIPADHLHAVFESELHEVIENLQPLNQAIADQQKTLESTLKLHGVDGQPPAAQKEHGTEDAGMAYTHPHYKKLRVLEFFKGFANSELLQFLDIAKWRVANTGDTVLNEGDVGLPFFIIVSGSVTIYKERHRLATLNQGDFFGEFAYLSGEEPYRSARVVAETACEFLMVDPLDIEFAPVQLRLHVVEALLRGQVRRTLISSQPMASLPGMSNNPHPTSP